jgi:SAM-dependent methyltransferase
MPFTTSAFDGAYAIESLLHCTDKERVLAECRRVLRPGGRVVIWDLIARADLPADAFPLANLFGFQDYRDVCDRNGFEILLAQDRGEEIIPLSLSAFARLLDSEKHRATLHCCHQLARAFGAGHLGYALFQLEKRP